MNTDNGGMNTDNWINLIAAILVGGGTLALAFMAWKSIRQNNTFRRKDRESVSRKRALDEILTWAQGVVDILSSASTALQ